ncbi:DUF3011 domain-containing protein [Phyllobacterium myrsinacearum]|uniref:DUF3011 domain-containing protein n=1 Tax=Phyllobacterium myrsinacearum TaxID=28101 RepID=A0A839EIN6_9HYPH|nr:DUF3011 domain-containing protein [Phyllobacterium myrsinacearum]MBA8878115.1 hypothetical protein [Phyllobacterium myrsinacearum]
MYRYILTIAVAIGGMQFVTVPAAQAQERAVRCESPKFRYRECNVDMRRPRIIRQTSKSPCIAGDSWGFQRGTLWVDKGCGAVFAEGGRERRRPNGGYRDDPRPRDGYQDDRYPRRDDRRGYDNRDPYYQPDDY